MKSTTDYQNNFQYENGVLQFIAQPEGYIYKDATGYRYVYQYKDHLGNNRLSFMRNAGTVAIVKETNYYPFGLTQKGYNNLTTSLGSAGAKKYQYNGKELQDDYGLDWYDYGARFYDAGLGRWFVEDPKAELGRRWTPYNYALNNPVRFIDPDGMWPDGNPLESIVNGVIKKAKDYVTTRIQQTILDLAKTVGNEVKKVEKNIHSSLYAKANLKISAGPNFASKVKGLGLDINPMTAEMFSIGGEADNTDVQGETNWVGKNGKLKIESSLGAGYEGLNTDLSHSFTVKQGGKIVDAKKSFEVGGGLPGIVSGLKIENQKNFESKTSKETLRMGLFFGGKKGRGWRVSLTGSIGYKITYKVKQDD